LSVPSHTTGKQERDIRAELNIPKSAKVIFVFGGSQGAAPINRIVGQSLKALLADVDAQGPTSEIVWCGFGEPTFRLDLIVEAAPWLRKNGAQIRLNTNGHACLIHGRDVLPLLAESVDKVSVSLNAPNFEKYAELCRPDMKSIETASVQDLQPFWGATLDFLRRAPNYFKEVQASVVGYSLTPEEIADAEALAQSLGISSFRIR